MANEYLLSPLLFGLPVVWCGQRNPEKVVLGHEFPPCT